MIFEGQKAYSCFRIGVLLSTTFALSSPFQKPLSHDSVGSIGVCFPPSDLSSSSLDDNSPDVPHVGYAAFEEDGDDDRNFFHPDRMTLYPLHVSGSREERVNLMFFSDGYTLEEEGKFVKDASKLKDDIVSREGAMSHVAHLLNVWATFVPSNASGIGSHDKPLDRAAFGLYRPAAELRAVFVNNPGRARASCRWFREHKAKQGGCDQPILLGNDPLYGGLGGEFTWHDLDISSWAISFNSSNLVSHKKSGPSYPTALLRASLSSIPHSSHITFVLNDYILDLADGFPKAWEGSLDRRWLEIPLNLEMGLQSGDNTIKVALTDEGRRARAGQGGKMIASLEIIEYGGNGRFNHTEGFIGAFPTYAMDGTSHVADSISIHPSTAFCPVCAHYLEKRLEDIISSR
ncbi:hypothetical protein I309_01276 [Cryptococcus deuterogattii LA55]|nr:hypothetical protein I309_01276 [Cryptococcus deuterogattii LA55]KIR95649.1 hypothetical protein I304_00404 [Cryptococcus deuterogattii CBS 10090]KIS02145.1 hypothetical protein L804_00405 [Cryptococcus deuterogattii 2001/935-1]